MSVSKNVQLPGKVICPTAVECCPAEETTVATDEGIYILSMQACPEHVEMEMIVHISKIEPNAQINEFDVAIDRNGMQQDIIESGVIGGDCFEIILNRTLSPAVESLQSNRGFVYASWSSPGGDKVGRPVLATLTGDHRLNIFSRNETLSKWGEVVKISHLFQELMKKERFLPAEERIQRNVAEPESKITRIKECTYLLASVALSWSPTFHESISESKEADSLKGKKESTCSRNVCFLATAQKSGHISIWKVRFPLLSKDDMSFTELVDPRAACPKVLHWCASNANGPGFVAIGYHNGLVELVGLQWVNNGSVDVTAGDTCTQAWTDVDNIPVTAISWDNERQTLFFAKGPYLFAVSVKLDQNGVFAIGKESHITVSPIGFINKIEIHGRLGWVSTVDDLVMMVKITHNDDDITISLGSTVEPPRELTGAFHPWKNHGFVVSKNRVFIGILSSPTWNYCHLEIRKPLKFDLLSCITPDEAIDLLLDASATNLLTDYTDALVYTKQIYRTTGTLPDILDMLVKDVEGWDSLSLFNMKLLRFLLQIEMSNTKEKPDLKKELAEKLDKATDLVLCTNACKTLKSIQHKLSEAATLTNTDRLALSLLATWTIKHGVAADDKTCAQTVLKLLGHKEVETCTICQENVLFTSIKEGCCSNGHRFGRCTQTLLLCQDVPYRVCKGCGSLAIKKESESLLLHEVLTDECSLCDNTLLYT